MPRRIFIGKEDLKEERGAGIRRGGGGVNPRVCRWGGVACPVETGIEWPGENGERRSCGEWLDKLPYCGMNPFISTHVRTSPLSQERVSERANEYCITTQTKGVSEIFLMIAYF